MATTFYLPSTGTAPISPAASTTWNGTGTGFGRRAAVTTRGTTAMTSISSGNTSTANAQYASYQWVYGPIAAVTISGNVEARVRARAGTFTNLFQARIAAFVVASNGTTVRGTLYSGEDTFSSSNLGTAFANYTNTVAVTSVAAQDGDYLVLEVGAERAGFTDIDEFYVEIGDTSSTNHMYFTFDSNIILGVAPTTLTYDYADTSRLDLLRGLPAPTHTPTTDGVGGLSYSVNTGALPTGLSLNSSTGLITGTPTVNGTYNATIRVSNSQGSADATLSWRVGTLGGGTGSLSLKL